MNVNKLSFAALGNISLTSIILASLCGVLPGCGKQPQTEEAKPVHPVKLFTVGAEEDMAYRFYPATIRSGRRVRLAFQVPGQLIEFSIKAGQLIRKGELLGKLDPVDYENTLKSAIARYKESKADYERYARLVEKHAVSVALFEEKSKGYEIAMAEMKIAAKALRDTSLTAPFDGVIAATYVDNFQNVQAKQDILSFQDTSDIELVVNVPEKDVINIPAYLPLQKIDEMFKPIAIFPALQNMSFPLKSKEFEALADTATHTFRIIFTMPARKKFSIMTGMTAMVRVRNGRHVGEANGYQIPAAAVREDAQGSKYVWLVNDQMVARKCTVTTGAMSGDRIVVNAGLKTGDVIISSGVSFVSEGMKIKEVSHIGGREIKKSEDV